MNNVISAIANTARRNPSKLALICPESTLSYGELETTTNKLARQLIKDGLKAGDRLAIHWSNSIESVELFIACAKAGIVIVPVNTLLKAPEVAFFFKDSGVSACFSEPRFAAISNEAARIYGALDVHTTLPQMESECIPLEVVPLPGHTPRLILYTSGTTSANPKGAVHTSQSISSITEVAADVWADSLEKIIIMTSMMHVSGSLLTLLPALLRGETAVLIPKFDASAVLDSIERFGCMGFVGIPFMAHALVAEQLARPRQVSSLRACYASGDMVSQDLQRDFREAFQTPLCEVFGMTETGLVARSMPNASPIGSFGAAVPGYSCRVLRPDDTEAVRGKEGELAVKSEALFVGYWGNKDATAQALRNGWFYTGDIVRESEDGYFSFVGRQKDVIIRFGDKISPMEIERALKAHQSVADVGVCGYRDIDDANGEQIVALVVLREDAEVNQEELLQFAKELLSDHKLPKQIFFVAQLPKNNMGKLHRAKVKKLAIETLKQDLSRAEQNQATAVG